MRGDERSSTPLQRADAAVSDHSVLIRPSWASFDRPARIALTETVFERPTVRVKPLRHVACEASLPYADTVAR